jgi:hypothetical protein
VNSTQDDDSINNRYLKYSIASNIIETQKICDRFLHGQRNSENPQAFSPQVPPAGEIAEDELISLT